VSISLRDTDELLNLASFAKLRPGHIFKNTSDSIKVLEVCIGHWAEVSLHLNVK